MTFGNAQEALTYLIGVFVPLLAALAKQPRFKGTKINLAISVAVCVVVGTITAWLSGDLVLAPAITTTIQSAISDIAIITSLAFVTYGAFWKDSKIENTLASKGLPLVLEEAGSACFDPDETAGE